MRDIIEQQLREKLLGPGYTRDLIVCNDDASDEILVADPARYVYCTGVLKPRVTDAQIAPQVADDPDEDGLFYDTGNLNDAGQPDADEGDDGEKGGIDTPDDRYQVDFSHVGLITCTGAARVRISVTYAKYVLIGNDDIGTVCIKAGDMSCPEKS